MGLWNLWKIDSELQLKVAVYFYSYLDLKANFVTGQIWKPNKVIKVPDNQIAQTHVILCTLAVYKDWRTLSFWHPWEEKKQKQESHTECILHNSS